MKVEISAKVTGVEASRQKLGRAKAAGRGTSNETLLSLGVGKPWSRSIVGGKAYYLELLSKEGFAVPRTLVVPIGSMEPDRADLSTKLVTLTGRRTGWKLAIRSSSAKEDSHSQSMAGHYLSLIGEFDVESARLAIENVRGSGPQMGVLIQPLIEARFSGVAFSCNPLRLNRKEISISWTEGLADGLVSGVKDGKVAIVNFQDAILSGEWPSTQPLLSKLVSALKTLEHRLGCPVDVEWVVDKAGDLWFVQLRPVVLPRDSRLALDDEANFDLLPKQVHQHHKIRLRREALRTGVRMAPAIVQTCTGLTALNESVDSITFKRAAGISVVLLFPERIDNKVIREFAAVHGTDVEFFAEGCRRYAIRRYPEAEDAASALGQVLHAGLKESWVAIGIAQAVLRAYATGIIRRFPNRYLIDVALGHFVPKGVVQTTTVILSNSKEVIEVNSREQSCAYHFIDGHVVTETPPHRQLTMSNDEFAQIAATFEPLFDKYPTAALEFGLLRNSEGLQIYLIDLAESDAQVEDLDTNLITSGVLSVGKCQGRVEIVAQSTVGDLDRHLHDRLTSRGKRKEPVVIVAERASVELLPLIGDPGVVGFVFEKGSILSHVAVVLRERAVPAVALEDRFAWEAICPGALIEVDGHSPSLPANKRVTIIESIND